MTTSWLYRRLFRSARPATARSAPLQCLQLEDRIVPYALSTRWTRTATDGIGLQPGDATTVTWSIMRDGVIIPGDTTTGEPTSPSELVAVLDAQFGAGSGGSDFTQRPWFSMLAESYDRLGQLSGLTFVYEPNDDGATFSSANIGVLGVRGDIRLGGHVVDGPHGTLAYAYEPNFGETVIDTADLAAGLVMTSPANNFLGFRNVLMHETGHAVGLDHVTPLAEVALMEPLVTTEFDGPQIDDILGLQRLYGDALEEDGGNDTLATAVQLGLIPTGGAVTLGSDGDTTVQSVTPTQIDFLSIDDDFDTDVYTFTVEAGVSFSLILRPVGPTYQNGPEAGPVTSFNSSAQSDLTLRLLDSTGTVLVTANESGLGGTESIMNFASSTGGTFHIRITGLHNRVQFYQLGLTSNALIPATITRNPSQPPLATTEPIRFDVTFASPVTGFTAEDILFTGTLTGLNATVTQNGAAGNRYFVDVRGMTLQGTVGIAIPEQAAVSLTGVQTAAATTPESELVFFDTVAPEPTFIPPTIGPTNDTTIPIVVDFGEPVLPFAPSSLVLVGATLDNFTVVSESTFSFDLHPTADGGFSVTLPAGLTQDLVGTPSLAGMLAGVLDRVVPLATLTRVSPPAINTAPAVFRVAFNEPIDLTSFTPESVSFTGSTVGGTLVATIVPDVAPNTYLIQVTGITGAGIIQVSLPEGSVTDLAGNPIATTVANAFVTFDGQPPTVAIAAGVPLPTNSSTVPVTVNFSDPATGFTAASLQLTGPITVTNFQTLNGGRTFTFNVNRTADGAFTVTVPDGAAVDPAGNPSEEATLEGSFDTLGPVPTVAPSSPSFADVPAVFTVTFAEDLANPTAFTTAHLAFGGTARPRSVTISQSGPRSFIVTISGMDRSGTVTLEVLAGAVTDLSGNPSAAAAVSTAEFTTTAPPPVNLIGDPQFAVGGTSGGTPVVRYFNPDGTERFSTPAFDSGVSGAVRTAVGDFTGDGVPDVVLGSGPGSPSLVRLLDGVTGEELLRVNPYEPSFIGGVNVAAGDLNGDGIPEVIVTPDEGGGPRVQVYRGIDMKKLADFFGISDPNFRGGARAATGDVSGDGRADLVIAAGFGGGPRISLYDGTTVTTGAPRHLIGDLFVFEQTLRNGAYVALGDLNGDGFADLIAGGGPGGAPRVFALSGADLMARKANRSEVLANFFAGDINNRGGVRVAVKNLDGDARADLIVGDGAGAGSRVTAYYGATFVGGVAPPGISFEAFFASTDGVFVG